MPKKSTSSRNATQRQKAKTPKSFELVRPISDADDLTVTTEDSSAEPALTTTSTATLAPVAASTTVTTAAQPELAATSSTPTGSASARIAARRQASLRTQQRGASTLITAEHFAYVRKDLMIIGTLAIVMLIIILVTYFTLGRSI